MKQEIADIKKVLEELNISVEKIKSITIKWEKIFPNKAFPRIKIKLFNDSNEKNE